MPGYEYVGKGKVHIQQRDVTGVGFIEVGNVGALSLAVELDSKSVLNYTSPGGGEAAKLERVKAVTGKLTGYDFLPANLAIALRASAAATATTAIVDEQVMAYPGLLAPLAQQPDTTVAPVVEAQDGKTAATWAATTAKASGAYAVPTASNGYYYKATTPGTTGSSQPTWPTTPGATVTDGTVVWTNMGKITKVAGTDYTVDSAGLVMTTAAGSCESGRVLLVDYTPLAADRVQALVNSGFEFRLLFAGLNEARSNKPVTVRLHRVKFSPTAGLDLIGDDFGKLDLSFSVLSDSTITGAGLSTYMQADLVR